MDTVFLACKIFDTCASRLFYATNYVFVSSFLPDYTSQQNRSKIFNSYYGDVIMSVMASQITSVSIVYLTVCSGADQRIHESSALLALSGERGKYFLLTTSSCSIRGIWAPLFCRSPSLHNLTTTDQPPGMCANFLLGATFKSGCLATHIQIRSNHWSLLKTNYIV